MRRVITTIQKIRRENKKLMETCEIQEEYIESLEELNETNKLHVPILEKRIKQETTLGELKKNAVVQNITYYNLKGPFYRLFHPCIIGEEFNE